jgi:hypothetical protein
MVDPVSAVTHSALAERQIESASNSVITAFAVASISLFIYGVFYPGLINFDTAEMLNQAVSGYCRDWHSPAIVVLWRVLNQLVPGPAALLGVGLALYSAGALYFAQLSAGRLLPCLGIFALLCLWPPLLNDLVVVGKDQLFATCFMLFIAFLLAALKEGRLGGGTMLWLVPLLFAACAVRHDSAVLLIPGLALLFRLKWRWKTAGALALGSMLITLAVVGAFNRFVAHAERDFPIQTTLIHDLAGISAQTDHPLIPTYADPGFDLPLMKQRYSPRTGDPLMFYPGQPDIQITNDKRQAEELKILWERSVLRYPRAYLQHRFASFTYLIGIEDPLTFQLFQLDTDLTMHHSYPHLADINLRNPDNAAVNAYRRTIIPALRDTLIFRGYAYDLVILLGIGLALYRRRKLQDQLIVALGSGALLHQAVLFFASPAALFRYLYPTVLTCLVILVLTGARAQASER